MAADKKEKPKSERPGFFRRIGRWFRELGGELKKVTWPKFGTVVKKTGVVIGVTLFFLACVMVIDVGLTQLYKLLIKGLETNAAIGLNFLR